MRSMQTIGILALAAALVGGMACGKDGNGGAETCDNGADDDGDGAVDCDDSECSTDAACGADTDPGTTDEDCNNGVDDDGDGAEDCDDSDCASDGDCAPTLLVPYYVGGGGIFGVDADNDQVVAIDLGGTPVTPTVQITIASEEYFSSNFDTQYSCTIILAYNGTDPLPLETYDFTYDGTAYKEAGFEMPDGEYDLTTDCTAEEGKELDESVMGSVEDIAATGWGATVGNFNPDIAAAIEGSDGGDGTTMDFVGGGFYWDVISQQSSLGLPDGVTPFDYGSGVGVSGSFEVLNSGGDPASADDIQNNDVLILDPTDVMNASGVPPTGAYFVNNLSGWTFGG
jgi:hypothetical protein